MLKASLVVAAIAAAAPVPHVEPASAPVLDLLKRFHKEFVEIAPGNDRFPASFKMGSVNGPPAERPVHEVRLSRRFAIAKYEVTQDLWKAVMGTDPSRWPGPRNSVEQVSFPEAVKFCEKTTTLMRQAGLITDQHVVRLPSEAEWEYAARAGSTTRYSFGDDADQLNDHAWHTGNAAGNDPPVGAKQPNAWGLYDVHGYVWEWCLDRPHAIYESAPTDGSAWIADGVPGQRVLRGGSWKDRAELLTSSYRRSAPEELKDDAVGFRCVLAEVR